MSDKLLIYKYPFLARTRNEYGWIELDIPKKGIVISCQEQNSQLCLWVLFPDTVPLETEKRRFYIAGTGNLFKASKLLDFIATVQQPPFVWHIFEEK